ncbi:MAG: LysR family transcriptional regulator [Chloroflexota bacterium]
MELHQLRYFIAVAEKGHFTRAADALHIAQPSVSQQIQKLEAELGARLFHRMKRGVTLTEAGETLLPWARRIVGDIAAARTEVEELASLQRGHVAIGATPSVATRFLPSVIAGFHARYPGISFTLREAGSQPLLSWLVQGELDVALLILPVRHPAIQTEHLFEESIMVGVPDNHPLAAQLSITIRDLRQEPFVMFRDGYELRDVTMEACHQAGFDPRVALEGGEMDSVLRLVSAGLGIALLPALVFDEHGPRPVPLRSPSLERHIGLAYRRDRTLPASARAFTEALRQSIHR